MVFLQLGKVERNDKMKAKEILEFFLNKADWFDKTKTVDRIIIGNPEKEINSILVTWMTHRDTIDYAIANGFDMIMTHEPTFWFHENELENVAKGDPSSPKIQTAKEKIKRLQDADIVVMRNHDVWDRFPEVGIPSEFAKALGITVKPTASFYMGYMFRYDVEPMTYEAFSKQVASACAKMGEEGIQVFGDSAKMVSKIGVGTGCCCDLDEFVKQGCDCAIICDDGQFYWRDTSWAIEIGFPVIRINHGTSEEAGMPSLAKYCEEQLHIKAEYYPHKQGFRIVK